jgi:tetratricopeptide (TPR) repeat protein
MTFRSIIYILTTVLFLACNFTSADSYVKLGHDIGMKGNYREAIVTYNKAIDKDPKFKEAYIQKGLCYEYLNQVDTAIKVYKDLLSFDPNNTTAYYYIGLCMARQNKHLEAIEFYNKALLSSGVNPDDTSNAQILITWNKDLMTADKASSYVPSYEIFYERGLAYYSTQQTKRAFLDFNNCISQKYNLGQCNYMIGLCWLKANKKVNACDAFRTGSLYGDSLSKVQLIEECM